jgi:hypothetical protein
MMALMIVNVDGLKLGGQLDRETSLVAFSYIVYFVHCAFSMLSENKFYLLTYSSIYYIEEEEVESYCNSIKHIIVMERNV